MSSDKTPCLGAEIVFSKVGERSMLEAKRDTAALYRLLTHGHGHLRDVNEEAIRTGDHHSLDVIVVSSK